MGFASSMKSVADVDKSHLCIGCGICTSIASSGAVDLKLGQDGFYHPEVLDEVGQEWEKVKAICPGITLRQTIEVQTHEEKMWGPIKGIWTGYATDDEIRWHASSGGGITGVLQYLLEKKVVDGVIHIGAEPSNPLMNATFISRNRSDILRQSGSRYAPAAPLVNIRQILDSSNEKFAFVGKPCDVAGLRAFLEVYPHYKSKVISLITFMCAGTPSMHGTEALIDALGINKEDVEQFWYRGRGWPGRATVIRSNGEQVSMSYNESWGKILNKHLHFRCKICPDGIGSIGDITFGDAWEEGSGYPSFEERAGQSLIIARNQQGRKLIEDAVSNGYLSVQKYSVGILDKIQPYQRDRRRLVAARLFALKLSGTKVLQFDGFNLLYNAILISPKANLESFLGTAKRIESRTKFGCAIYLTAQFLNELLNKLGLMKRSLKKILNFDKSSSPA